MAAALGYLCLTRCDRDQEQIVLGFGRGGPGYFEDHVKMLRGSG